jgi:hypothetical protein
MIKSFNFIKSLHHEKTKEDNPIKILAEELFSGVKDKKKFNTILSELFKHGIETVLKAELDEHLGHDKHGESSHGNYRNGTSKKTVKCRFLNMLTHHSCMLTHPSGILTPSGFC